MIRKTKIREVCKINGLTYSPKENWEFVNYLDTGNIINNKIESIQYIDPIVEKLPSRARRKVKNNNIIYSTVRPNQKHFGIIKSQPEHFLVSTGFAVLDVNENYLNPYYLYYLLTQNEYIDTLQAIAEQSTSTYPSIKPSDIGDLNIEFPTLKIQNKIVNILNTIDKKIELNEEINKNLLHQLDILYDEFSHRENWSTAIINDVAEKVAMGPFGSNIKVSTFVSEGIPIISGNHLRGYFLEEPSFNYITEEHAQRLKNSLVYPKDIVFTHAGNIGQVAMIPDDCRYQMYVLSQRQFYLRCDTEKAIPEYVLLFFHSKQGQYELLSYANQTGVPSIAQPATNLKKIPLKLPPIDEQRQWLQLVSPIIKLYQSNVFENEHLSSMRDSLLPKLMSGELDVSGFDL